MTSGTYIRSGCPVFDDLPPLVASFLAENLLTMEIDGHTVEGFRSPDARSVWIRDHSDMLRGAKYFFHDLTSATTHFAETQAASGRIFDYFTTFPEKPPSERENWTKYVRVPVEADVEYRFIKAVYLAWQATGDDTWLERMLPHMTSALRYVMHHPWYWDETHGLVRRPYTIDTWDFAYTAGRHEWLQFQINRDTFWGIMHGDNSGYFEALRLTARVCTRLGRRKEAAAWEAAAAGLAERMNAVCWNGSFYTHFIKLNDVCIPGVAEAEQLSLSCPMDINRGVAGHAQAVAILEEYQRRRNTTPAFAEWFSIDPPFPDGVFGDPKLKAGAYVNGGILPLVGGELARAAFEHGHEAYGVDILRRYHGLVAERRESYLWYFPDGTPASIEASTSPEAKPTDGWGSTAMLYALIEGLAGVYDAGCGFDRLRLAPRWPAAGVDACTVRVTYAASGRTIGYAYRLADQAIHLDVQAMDSETAFHVLLPTGSTAAAVALDGRVLEHDAALIENSRYVDFSARIQGAAECVITLKEKT